MMTRKTPLLVLGSALATMVLSAAGAALAQSKTDDPEPWRQPAPPPPIPRATSSLDATKPTAAQQHQSRMLAGAIFAKPSAAQRAEDKVAAANAPAIPPTDPKKEWLAEPGIRLGGEGLQVSKPF